MHDLIISTPPHRTYATIDGKEYRCSVGKNGLACDKKEGDNCTPIGQFPLRRVFYRPDKINPTEIRTSLPTQVLTPSDGWCDDPQAPEYNQFVNLETFNTQISYENLWRTDDVYDLIIVVGYNDDPVAPGKGSAIFIHIARENYAGTAGCVAFSKGDLLKILFHLSKDSSLIVLPKS